MKSLRILAAFFALLFLIVTNITAQKQGFGLRDIDGNVYSTVIIGNQEWMAENLKVRRFRNGVSVPFISSSSTWASGVVGYSIYPPDLIDGLSTFDEVFNAYGLLYNGAAFGDSRNLCPAGWFAPSSNDWTLLVNALPSVNPGNHLKSRRQVDSPLGAPWATTQHPRWASNTTHHGADSFGFNALPAGLRNSDGSFASLGGSAFWWNTATSISSGISYRAFRSLSWSSGNFTHSIVVNSTGHSVRCFRPHITADPFFDSSDGLRVNYPFNGDGLDDSANQHNASTTNIQFTQDRFGRTNRAAYFGGQAQQIIETPFPGITGNAARSISFWMKPDALTEQMRYVMSWGNINTATNAFAIFLGRPASATGTNIAYLGIDTGGSFVGIPIPGVVMPSTWHHVVITFTPGTTSTMTNARIYIDGHVMPKDFAFNTSTVNTTGGTPLVIGGVLPASAQRANFAGNLDDLRIYNRQLSPEEVKALYEADSEKPVLYALDFEFSMQVSDVGGNQQTLTFGTSDAATTGYDENMDVFAPPSPPAVAFDARILAAGEGFFRFIQPVTTDERHWVIRVSPQTGFNPITISWDRNQLNAVGTFYLTDTTDGTDINVNMRNQSSLELDVTDFTELRFIHTLNEEIGRSYRADWNIVGMPVRQIHDVYRDVFKGSVVNTLFSFDGKYEQVDSLQPGRGYWLRYPVVDAEAPSETFWGYGVYDLSLQLSQGWNLISGPTVPAVISDPNGITIAGTLYKFDGAYQPTDRLEPGLGYWIRARQAGDITLAWAFSKGDISTPRPDLNGFDELRFISGEVTRSLYFGANQLFALPDDDLSFSLPPLPPTGVFDVRLDGDLWLSDTDEVVVDIHPGLHQTYLLIEGAREYNLTAYGEQGVLLRAGLSGGEKLIIPDDARMLRVLRFVEEGVNIDVPGEFALEQNFPNPFNPTTAIRYALPEAAQVRLEVYTMAGQRVAVLASGEQRAGWHTAMFDGSNLASGVYIYRLQAGGFVQTRKLILIK
jgi:uncharacterized protein (TIGR02145 family)